MSERERERGGGERGKENSRGLHLDNYEPISFKLGVMIDMIAFYILIPVLTAFQQKLPRSFSRKFLGGYGSNLACYHALLVC